MLLVSGSCSVANGDGRNITVSTRHIKQLADEKSLWHELCHTLCSLMGTHALQLQPRLHGKILSNVGEDILTPIWPSGDITWSLSLRLDTVTTHLSRYYSDWSGQLQYMSLFFPPIRPFVSAHYYGSVAQRLAQI